MKSAALPNERVKMIGEKLIIKNHRFKDGKHRVSKLYAKKLTDGKIFISVKNGTTKDGQQRQCHFMFEPETLEQLKLWLEK